MLKQLMKYEGVMVKNVCCIALLTLMFVGSETQGQQGVSTFTNTLSNAAGTNGLVRDANQDWNEVFSAFPVPPDPNIEIDARLTLADLISHFNKSSITNNFIKHENGPSLVKMNILEQAHSTVGPYSFTINRAKDREAARGCLAEVYSYGHQGAMNGVFVICIHKGFKADPVLEVFRAFVPPPLAAGSGK
jgi:hypothetical protein